MDMRGLQDLLKPHEARVLLAVKRGMRTQENIARSLGYASKSSVRIPLRRLEHLGYVSQRAVPWGYLLAKPWTEVMADLRLRAKGNYMRQLVVIDDYENEPAEWIVKPDGP